MRRILSIVLTWVMLLSVSGSAMAAAKKTQPKRLTRTYTDMRLGDVLADIGKRTGYKVDYSLSDLDAEQRVSASFKDRGAVSAVKKLVGKTYIVSAKRGVITITNPPQPPVVIEHAGLQPVSETEDATQVVQVFEDTTLTIRCRTERVQVQESPAEEEPLLTPLNTSKPFNHFLELSGGVGYGSLGYALTNPADGKKAGVVNGGLSGFAELRYLFFFTDNWGVSAGVAFSGYESTGTLNTLCEWPGQGDTDGEQYDHRTVSLNWKEKQQTRLVEIPIGVQYISKGLKQMRHGTLRLYGAADVRIGFPVSSQYRLLSGSIEHQGYYPQWNMLVVNQPDRDFYTETIGADFATVPYALPQQKVSVSVGLEAGVLIPLTKQLDLLAGAYFHIVCTNQAPSGKQDMGWRQSGYTGAQSYRNHTFMNPYAGMLSSTMTGAEHPWSVGVKVGLRWHVPERGSERLREVKKGEERLREEVRQVCDTAMTLTRRTETFVKTPKESTEQLAQLMQKSVIWFDVNSTVPKLKPADILDRIAAILMAHPDQVVIVSGHASQEGNATRNQLLSEERAQVIADLLVSKGVRREQLRVEAHAADQAYDPGDGSTSHAISLDRRTEIIPVP